MTFLLLFPRKGEDPQMERIVLGSQRQWEVRAGREGPGGPEGLWEPPGPESPGPATSHPGAQEVGDESVEQAEPHMFLMTQTLFPAPATNRREMHIWDHLRPGRSRPLWAPSPVVYAP